MQRSVTLASGLWLLLAGCADAAPAKSPAPPPAPAARASYVSVSANSPTSALSAPPQSPASAPASHGSSEQQLAARFGGARALSVQSGTASYYSDALAGHATASGAPYQPHAFTAAHRSLPFGSVLRVTRPDGGQIVYVRVTDRGPYGSRGRILDLSRAAAERLGMLRAGVVKVRLEVLEYGPDKKSSQQGR